MLSLKRMHKWISQSQSPHSVNQWGKKRRKNRIKLVVSKHLIQEVIHYMINSLIVYVAVHSVSEIVRKYLIFRLVSFQHFDFIDIFMSLWWVSMNFSVIPWTVPLSRKELRLNVELLDARYCMKRCKKTYIISLMCMVKYYQGRYSLKQWTFSIRRQTSGRIKKLKRNNTKITQRTKEHANCK